MAGLLAALGLLTVIPSRSTGLSGARQAAWWFVPIGLAVGGIAALAWVAVSLVAPVLIADFVAVVVLLAITGGVHFDGVVDSADALFAAAEPERRLEILRDARAGSFGIAAGITVFAGKLVALAAMPPEGKWAYIVIAATVGAATMVAVMRIFPYARGPEGLGFAFRQGAGAGPLATGLVLALAAAVVLAGLWGIALLAGGLVAALAFGWFATRRLGGVTGDIYGATAEWTQVAVLLLAAVIAGWSV